MCRPLLLFLFTVSTVLKVGCQIPNASMPGFDYRIFKHTPCWELAKAIDANDSSKVRQLAQEQHMAVNCFDPHYGTSLLDVAIINNKTEAFEALLQAGVNVNARSPKNSTTALFHLCTYSATGENTLFYLSRLIQHGADVNVSVPDSLDNVFAPRTCLEQFVLNTRRVETIGLVIGSWSKAGSLPIGRPRCSY